MSAPVRQDLSICIPTMGLRQHGSSNPTCHVLAQYTKEERGFVFREVSLSRRLPSITTLANFPSQLIGQHYIRWPFLSQSLARGMEDLTPIRLTEDVGWGGLPLKQLIEQKAWRSEQNQDSLSRAVKSTGRDKTGLQGVFTVIHSNCLCISIQKTLDCSIKHSLYSIFINLIGYQFILYIQHGL